MSSNAAGNRGFVAHSNSKESGAATSPTGNAFKASSVIEGYGATPCKLV